MKRSFILLLFASLLFGCSHTANCATCHQPDGYGVPNMQPALVDDDIVAGDPTQIIRVVVQGPVAVLPPGRPAYGNTMPSFTQLTDEQIADVLTYIRHEYGHNASVIDAQDVRTVRSQFGY
jgi:mono/diheme cytochrome c family protein